MNLEEIRKLKPEIQALARQYKIEPESIRVFGSVARGEATENSDIDFLVRTMPGCGLIRLGGFYVNLEKLLNHKVDVITEGGLSPYIGPSILQSAKPL